MSVKLSTVYQTWPGSSALRLHLTVVFQLFNDSRATKQKPNKIHEKSAKKMKKNTEYPTFPPLPTKREVITLYVYIYIYIHYML